jgi:hypothetical protein
MLVTFSKSAFTDLISGEVVDHNVDPLVSRVFVESLLPK